MSEIEIHVENVSENVGEEIKERIDRSVREAADKIARGMKDSAEDKIVRRRAVFSGELRNSFRDSWGPRVYGYEIELQNIADHASFVDKGVRGTRSGTGPHAYTTERPPLKALIPWVEAKLRNWTILELGDGERELVPKR
jgi:hypothetical protein